MKAEDYLDDLETVASWAAEKGKAGIDYIANSPLPTAIGSVISNPTPQEIGAQAVNLGKTLYEGVAEEFSKPPEELALNWGPGGIGGFGAMTAYHGTPHKIVGGFKKEAIGSGEGAQAFGHGFYATEARGIARGYAKDLSKNIYEISGQRFEAQPHSNNLEIFQMWDKYGKDHAIKFAENEKRGLLGSGPFTIKEAQEKGADSLVKIRQKRVAEIDRLIPLIRDGELKKISTGRIYTLDIPEPDVMLDWDKPFNEQPKAVKDILENSGFPWIKQLKEQPTGKHIYDTIGTMLSEDKPMAIAASEYLASKGIKGINYPAGSISGAKTTARNYVIFEPEDIKITAEEFLDQ